MSSSGPLAEPVVHSEPVTWMRHLFVPAVLVLLSIEVALLYYGSVLTMPLMVVILVVVFARPGLKFIRSEMARPDDDPDASQVSWKRLYLATAIFLLVAEALLIYYGAALTTPLVLLILLLVFARPGQKLRFVRDFGPFLLVLFAYYSMWGSADDVRDSVMVTPQIDAERWLFGGHIPTIVMQEALYDPDKAHWYDFLAVVAHLSHFVVPIFFAAIIWQHYRHLHIRFMSSFVLLSYTGFLTFLLIPSAPPWWAAQEGYIDQVYLVHHTVPGLSRIYSDLSANPVAAVPSLHAAMPWLIFLFSVKIWGRKALAGAVYPVFIWWSIVYSGHHYFVDAVAGVAYGTFAFYALSGHPYGMVRRLIGRKRDGDVTSQPLPLAGGGARPVPSNRRAA